MTRIQISPLQLNVAGLVLGLTGAALAAYPALFPFHGQQLQDVNVSTVAPQKTPAFENWEAGNDRLARWGLVCVALGTVAGAAAQITERTSRKSRVRGSSVA